MLEPVRSRWTNVRANDGSIAATATHHPSARRGWLVDVAEDARERARRAHVGAMAEVRHRPWRFDVRAERALLVPFAERDEHDEQLRHQGQTAAEATKPVQTCG